MKILVIEDERDLSQNIVSYLSTESYVCECAYTFDEAMEKVALYSYDCILLDLVLPGGDGLAILREIKQRDSRNAVIIISARGSLDDKVAGIKIGADDYLPKPFFLPELSVRIYALIRRKEFGNSNLIQSGSIVIDLLSKEVRVEDRLVLLTKSEYELLLFFVGNRNRVISKSAIAEHLSGDMADMLDNQDFVYAHIKNLKSKLNMAGHDDCIKNVYGTGYKWVE